ncbi:MAG: glycine--tRNA ligase [Planctomycetaceae bacterium]|nr:glycine--tRNA ligase [Planctomycetaceae bacterium]
MDKVVALCKRRGFIFQSSEIYGGLNGFWDYGPLGVELKRNVKDAWWRDMVTNHDEFSVPPSAPQAFAMTGLDCSIIMHPQVWKVSGHFDLFCDYMTDCRETKRRYRIDQMRGRWVEYPRATQDERLSKFATQRFFIITDADTPEAGIEDTALRARKFFGRQYEKEMKWQSETMIGLARTDDLRHVLAPDASEPGTLTEPREFNLMFKTIVGARGGADDAAFLRPETAQGIFANFKNVCDTVRVRVPFGICQIGKSFRNEITPRNFTFRSREFEQMELEFFCHPKESRDWYTYWRDRRYQWYLNLGLKRERLQLRDHAQDELSHYSVGTADIEYAFPFLEKGEFGELEGVAHRGDFDLRSHMEGKLVRDAEGHLNPELGPDGKPKHAGSGKDLSYFDDQARERFVPHVIEPSAGADRATLAFICEAYTEDQQPDEKGEMQTRVLMKFHPRLAPIKVAVLPLVKKDGMPEMGLEIYRALKAAGIASYFDQQAAIGKRYRRQDEIGTPWCLTVDGQSLQDKTVTLRDRDTLEQRRVSVDTIVDEITQRLRQ